MIISDILLITLLQYQVSTSNYYDGLGRCFRFVCVYACAAAFLCCYGFFRRIKIYIMLRLWLKVIGLGDRAHE